MIGETYQLTVILNGVTYLSTETLTGTPDISPDIVQNDKGGFSGDEIEIGFSFQDDGAKDNYYMVGIGSNRIAYPEYKLESDEQFQGKKMTEYYSHEDLKKEDSLNIRLYGVSRRFFDYFKKILLASGQEGSPFPTTPTTVRGNIINQANKEELVLGHFRLSEIVERKYRIQ